MNGGSVCHRTQKRKRREELYTVVGRGEVEGGGYVGMGMWDEGDEPSLYMESSSVAPLYYPIRFDIQRTDPRPVGQDRLGDKPPLVPTRSSLFAFSACHSSRG